MNKLKNLLEFSKTKKLNNVKKSSNVHYQGYLELLEATNFLEDVSIKERLYYIDIGLDEYIKCYTCDNKAYWNDRGKHKHEYNKYCAKCAKKSPEYRENYRKSMLDKYGVEHNWSVGKLRNKDLKNQVLKYGTDDEIDNIDNITSVFQLDDIKNKSKTTMLDKYGVEHNWSVGKLRNKDLKNQVLKYGTDDEIDNIDNITSVFQLDDIKNKSKTTMLDKYGVEQYNNYNKALESKVLKYGTDTEINNIDNITSPWQLTNIKIKSKLKKLQLYGNSVYVNSIAISKSHRIIAFKSMIESFKSMPYTLMMSENDFIDSKIINYACDKCGSMRESYWPYIRCTTCFPYNMSTSENEVLEYCQSLSSNVESNSRKIISPLELDIYIPDHNLAIEYDGLYWHSSEYKDKYYHLNKTDLCQEKSIQLFHIFENEWLDTNKQIIWKSIIKNKLGQSERIYARKTKVATVSSVERKDFLNMNHLQGNCVSSVNLGLYLEDELVSLMTFGKSRYNKNVDWELLRFCNKRDHSVVGGASKLLKAFRRENVGSIISYADKRRSTGGLYKALGFELSHESPPNYFYFMNGSTKLESRIKYQKHKLKKVLDKFDSELTESENMYNNKYCKIYDCGNSVWIKL